MQFTLVTLALATATTVNGLSLPLEPRVLGQTIDYEMPSMSVIGAQDNTDQDLIVTVTTERVLCLPAVLQNILKRILPQQLTDYLLQPVKTNEVHLSLPNRASGLDKVRIG